MSSFERLGPLGTAEAELRARQVAVLADPVRLRLMSILATQPDAVWTADSLAFALGHERELVSDHLTALLGSELVETGPADGAPRFRPTAEAWVRFGRLLAGKSAYRPPVKQGSEVSSSVEHLPSAVQATADRLAYRFSSYFSRETVYRYVSESFALLADRASVTRHLPSLTSRFATDRLSALASAQGFDLRGTPEILFVCVQNSGRSQMAAGILRQLAGDQVHVRTAGSSPALSIDPMIVDVLDEVGVPIVSEFPKPLTDEVVQAADIVVTMGCGDACPVYAGRRYLDWPIDDPVGKPIDEVRGIRDEIFERVRGLLRTIALEGP